MPLNLSTKVQRRGSPVRNFRVISHPQGELRVTIPSGSVRNETLQQMNGDADQGQDQGENCDRLFDYTTVAQTTI